MIVNDGVEIFLHTLPLPPLRDQLDTRDMYDAETVSLGYDHSSSWGALVTRAGVSVQFAKYPKFNQIKDV